MKIFNYIEFGIGVAESVASVAALVQLKQPLAGPELTSAVQPGISGLQLAFNVTLPAALVTDIAQSAADAINKYVLKLS